MVSASGERLTLRADASTEIGTGHVMRCLALAQAWRDAGGRATFLMAMTAPALEDRVRSEGIDVIDLSAQSGGPEDARRTIEVAQQHGGRWIVLDGYQFGPPYRRLIHEAGLPLLLIDDQGGAGPYDVECLLNQNLHAEEGLYVPRGLSTQLLLGTRYALLRREFLSWAKRRRTISDGPRHVLVTLGGGDKDNVTRQIVLALRDVHVDGLEVVVALGVNNPHENGLESAIQNSRVRFRLERDSRNMAALMAWADVAVSGAGSTCWELSCLGVPFLVVVLAENQRAIAASLARTHGALNLGWHADLSPAVLAEALTTSLTDTALRQRMSDQGRLTVDGLGAPRVVDRLLQRPRRAVGIACDADSLLRK